MKTYIFECKKALDFYPISQTKPVFDIRIGSETFLDRICNLVEKKSIALIVREEISDIALEAHHNFTVNPDNIEDGLWLSGRVIWDKEAIKLLTEKNTVYICDGDVVAANLSSDVGAKWHATREFNSINNENISSIEINVKKCNYLWDILEFIPYTILEESLQFEPIDVSSLKDVIIMEPEKVFVSNSQLLPNIVINAQNGPVIIESNVIIGSQSYIEGPAFVGNGTVVTPLAKIKNCVIGPYCRVGGEVESSIIQGFSNKVHDGHLGDSYLGEWVNFGAGTSNSNLNNNYSSVKVQVRNSLVDTEKLHIGCFVGDHVKTSIGTLINTGSVIGPGSMIASPGLIPKTIPSLSWYVNKKFMNINIDKFFTTAVKVKERRDQKFSKAEKKLFKKLQNLN